MAFPFSYEAEFRSTVRTSGAQLLRTLEDGLLRLKASDIVRAGDAVQFTATLFRFVTNWNLLVFIDKGQIEVHERDSNVHVRYRIEFARSFFLVTFLVGTFFGVQVFRAPNLNVAGKLAILGFSWAWLFSANYVISVIRFRRWLIRNLHTSEPMSEESSHRPEPSRLKQVTPFDPPWQPAWLKAIRWRWKLLLLSIALCSVWNGFFLTQFPQAFKDLFNDLSNTFSPVFVWGMVTGSLIIIVLGSYFVGRSLDRWNDKVKEQGK